jgi:hypothetical protein
MRTALNSLPLSLSLPPLSSHSLSLSPVEPQAIFDMPLSDGAQSTNSSAVINWVNPGGTVNYYVVQYVLARDPMGFASDNVVTVHVLVSPDETSVTVGDENLLPGATYSFHVAVNNSRGLSAFSPQGRFQILGKERPHIPVVL